MVPSILGFDPRYQFIHEDDIVGVLEHAVRDDLPGVYNAAGDGVLVLSEVASLLGKPLAPILPPCGTGLAMRALRPLGVNVPPEMLTQLRFGRGVDNRKLKAAGAPLRHTTRETVQAFAEHLRVAAIKRRWRCAVPLRARGRGIPALQPLGASGKRRASKIAGLVAGTPPVLPSFQQVRSRSFFIVATLVVLLVAAAGGHLRVRLRP